MVFGVRISGLSLRLALCLVLCAGSSPWAIASPYTDRGEVYTLTLPDSSVETWSYNGNGDVSAYTNPLSQTISYAFDDAGRQTGVDYPAARAVRLRVSARPD